MHISDGIISAPVCVAAHVAAMSLVVLSGRKAEADEIPKMGIIGAALFVTSLIHFPLAGTSIHLGLFGLAGIILGKRAFPVVYTALLFQSLAFQHGGLLTLGVNAINMGAGAWIAWLIWRYLPLPVLIRALMAGFAGIIVPALLMVTAFKLSGYGSAIHYLLLVYLMASLIEAGITGFAVLFIKRVNPAIICRNLKSFK